jgi:hypothetical protein
MARGLERVQCPQTSVLAAAQLPKTTVKKPKAVQRPLGNNVRSNEGTNHFETVLELQGQFIARAGIPEAKRRQPLDLHLAGQGKEADGTNKARNGPGEVAYHCGILTTPPWPDETFQ